MFAEIIAIGSELTSGSKLDTNSQWLSRELEALGWTVTRHLTISDDMASIVNEFQQSSRRANVVLITGGLGPTLDDITRDALAEAFGQKLVRDDESLRQIETLFKVRGRVMPERNQRQADRPEHAVALPNSCGTAPGVLMRVARPDGGECLFAAMPGVPAEMRPMFENQIRPQLPGSGMVLCRRVLRSFGYGESEAERMLGDLTARGRNPEVGITASEAVISLWVTARSASQVGADADCENTMSLIRSRLGEAIYAEGHEELHEVVAKQIASRNRRIALIEGATTGGLLSLWLTEKESFSPIVSSSEVKFGRWPEATTTPAAWAESVRAFADETRRRLMVDYLILSSPFEDEVSESGVVLRRGWIAIAADSHFETADVSMSGNLAIFRQRAARTALNRVRLHLSQR
jgi:nicotinamide-nucleotide amidase